MPQGNPLSARINVGCFFQTLALEIDLATIKRAIGIDAFDCCDEPIWRSPSVSANQFRGAAIAVTEESSSIGRIVPGRKPGLHGSPHPRPDFAVNGLGLRHDL